MKRIIQLAERLSLFENYNSTNFYFENQSIYSISTIDSLSLCGFKEKLNIQLLEEKIIALKNKKNFLLMNIEEEQDNLREEKNILKVN